MGRGGSKGVRVPGPRSGSVPVPQRGSRQDREGFEFQGVSADFLQCSRNLPTRVPDRSRRSVGTRRGPGGSKDAGELGQDTTGRVSPSG